MSNRTALIKKFKTEQNFYIYDTWTNEILQVHPDFWNYLEDADNDNAGKQSEHQGSEYEKIKGEIEKAKKQGHLSTNRPQVATYYGWENWKENIYYQINNNLQQLTLSVSEICNFRCSYCVYSDHYKNYRYHSQKKMSWEIAKQAIDYAMNHISYREKNNLPFAISFYGGEPLCNFELIKKCVLYCNEKYNKKNIEYNMTTNGSLINEKIAKFLCDNNFNIVISIDGPQYIHDRYRKTVNSLATYKLVINGLNNIKKFNKNKNMNITINCVLHPPYSLNAIAEFVNSFEGRVRIDLTFDYNTTVFNQFNMVEEQSALNSQLQQWFKVYMDSVTIGNSTYRSKLGKSLFEPLLIKLHKRDMNRMKSTVVSHGQCILASRKLFVTCDGQFYPCERVSKDLIIGNINDGIDIGYICKLLESWSNFLHGVCSDCWAVRLCQKCMVYFDSNNNFQNNNIKDFCLRQKNTIEGDLIRYCSILECNLNSFDFMKNIIIG